MKRIKRIVTLLLVLAIMGSVIPAQAACSTPNCVKKAAQAAMEETGMGVCLVVKTDKTGKGTAYMMTMTKKGNAKCDRSGAVILGKNTKVKKCYTYFFLRNHDFEKNVTTWKSKGVQYRWRYQMRIDCDQDADYGMTLHSYIEYKQKNTWKTCKGTSKNVDGIAACKEFVRYLRSMADPYCPVVFLF